MIRPAPWLVNKNGYGVVGSSPLELVEEPELAVLPGGAAVPAA